MIIAYSLRSLWMQALSKQFKSKKLPELRPACRSLAGLFCIKWRLTLNEIFHNKQTYILHPPKSKSKKDGQFKYSALGLRKFCYTVFLRNSKRISTHKFCRIFSFADVLLMPWALLSTQHNVPLIKVPLLSSHTILYLLFLFYVHFVFECMKFMTYVKFN
jgi:hypothetical protein